MRIIHEVHKEKLTLQNAVSAGRLEEDCPNPWGESLEFLYEYLSLILGRCPLYQTVQSPCGNISTTRQNI